MPDVVWMPSGRFEEITETGDLPTRAPDVCVEVLSSSNTEEEFREKRELYFVSGAEEVWIVDDEEVRFFGQEEMETSEIVPAFPKWVE